MPTDPLMTNKPIIPPDNLMGSSKNSIKGTIIVPRRINKTFAVNTPEQSCDKVTFIKQAAIQVANPPAMIEPKIVGAQS